MKKIIVTIAAAALTASMAQAQVVYGYSLEESTNTYTPITDGTVIFDGSTLDSAPLSGLNKMVYGPEGSIASAGDVQGYPIGFDYPLAGESMNQFAVCLGGYINLGNNSVAVNPNASNYFMTQGSNLSAVGCIAQRGTTATSNTVISYKTIGQGTDAVLVVQFENTNVEYTFWGDAACVDYQIRLSANGDVQYVFNKFAPIVDPDTQETTDFSVPMHIGIVQLGNYVCATGTLGNLVLKQQDSGLTNLTQATPDGTTITFKAPAACVTPAAQPTDLVLTPSSSSVSGSFAACDGADTYLVVRYAANAEVTAPANKVNYEAGSEIGEGTVVYFGPKTTFTDSDLPGGTDYKYVVYAAMSYGLNGPAINTASPLTANVATCPAPAKSAEILSYATNSFVMSIEANDKGNDVVVLFTPYVQQDNYGDRGYFGVPAADAKAGDVLPLTDEYVKPYELENALAATNAGTVGYAGPAADNISVEGLEPGTLYYVEVLSRDADGNYSSDAVSTGIVTEIDGKYASNWYNYPRYNMPFNWQTAETDQTSTPKTFSLRDEPMYNFRTGGLLQGTNHIQFAATTIKTDASNGTSTWVTTPKVKVSEPKLTVTYQYNLQAMESRFSTIAYNDWEEKDVLEIRVSKDGGESWTTLTKNDASNNAKQDTLTAYVTIAADLEEYFGEEIQLQLYWETYASYAFGMKMYVNSIVIADTPEPVIPEVTVGAISADQAEISWIGAETDYEVSYAAAEGEETTVKVEGAKAYTITGLEANTTYTVKVRGLLDEGEYSDWSEPIEFTTTDWPEVDAPTNLASDFSDWENSKVTLSWQGTEEMLSYVVAYRTASSTEWTYVDSDETSVCVELEPSTDYIWKVMAKCTHNRETEYSAQDRFTTPVSAGIDAITGDGVSATETYNVAGQRIPAATKGVNIIRLSNGTTRKVYVK